MNSTTNAKLRRFVDNRLFWTAYSPINKAAGIVGEIGVSDVFEIAVYLATSRAVESKEGEEAPNLDQFLDGSSS